MKKFFEEYGFVALASIVVVLLISMASPVGNLIKASTAELVTTCGDSTNSFVNSFEVTDLNGPTVNLISFTIGGTSYQAIEGMTWEEWVRSDYNTKGFKIEGNYVVTYYYAEIVKKGGGGTEIKISDLIIENNNYTLGMFEAHSG